MCNPGGMGGGALRRSTKPMATASFLSQPALAAQALPQGLADQKLHHKVGTPRQLPRVEDRGKPWVIDSAMRRASATKRCTADRLVKQRFVDGLDRDLLAGLVVNSLEDHAHPTAAHLAQHAIFTDPLTDRLGVAIGTA